MKVILTQEVKGKGGEGDVVDVARGFAVNYLFPRKMAIAATSGNLKQLDLRVHNIQTREEGRVAEAQAIADSLEGKTVKIEAKVGEGGRLFGSVTSHMIEDAILSQLDADVDRRKVDVHGPFKEVGEHPVTVQVYREIKADVIIKVVPEGGVIIEEPTTAEAIIAEADAEEAADAEVSAEAEEAVEATEAEVSDESEIPAAAVDDEVLVVEAVQEDAEEA